MNQDFILTTHIEDETLCDDIVEYYKTTTKKYPGNVGSKSRVDQSIKKCTETLLNFDDKLFARYVRELRRLTDLYEKKFVRSRMVELYGLVEEINVQHYKPNEGYFAWHCERCNSGNDRHLVFMTYLNDVNDGGETEFLYQNLKVRPKKGLTLMWPVDWTHTHRGLISPTQDKYITTGWLSFIKKEMMT